MNYMRFLFLRDVRNHFFLQIFIKNSASWHFRTRHGGWTLIQIGGGLQALDPWQLLGSTCRSVAGGCQSAACCFESVEYVEYVFIFFQIIKFLEELFNSLRDRTTSSKDYTEEELLQLRGWRGDATASGGEAPSALVQAATVFWEVAVFFQVDECFDEIWVIWV